MAMSKKKILHYPQLDTVLMAEKFIREHSGKYRRKELWQKLPRKMMYQTFQVILGYLLDSGKVSVNKEGNLAWTRDAENEPVQTDIREIKKIAVPVLRKNGVTKAAIFGSYAKASAKKGSDIDILVDIRSDISLLDFVGIKLELEKALKRKVDLVEYNTIKPILKGRILKDQVKIL